VGRKEETCLDLLEGTFCVTSGSKSISVRGRGASFSFAAEGFLGHVDGISVLFEDVSGSGGLGGLLGGLEE
jgi:hypothetical protein